MQYCGKLRVIETGSPISCFLVSHEDRKFRKHLSPTRIIIMKGPLCYSQTELLLQPNNPFFWIIHKLFERDTTDTVDLEIIATGKYSESLP